MQELRIQRRRARHFAWSDLLDVEETADALLIRTRGDTLRLPWTMTGSRAMAAALNQHFRPSEAEHELPTPDQINLWLGIAPSESLAVDRSPVLGALGLIGLTIALVWWALELNRPILYGLGLWPVFASSGYSLTDRWQVDGNGFRYSTTHSSSWEDVVAVHRTRSGWVVETDFYSIPLRGPNGRRVADVVERVLAAKQAKVVVPGRMGPSDFALSRATASEAAVDRGLSRPE